MTRVRTAAVIGANGLVGRAVARELAGAGWNVVAVARDEARLGPLAAATPGITPLGGSVDGDAAAAEIAARVRAIAPSLDAVVTSVNLPAAAEKLLDCTAERLVEVLRGNIVTHHSAVRAFLPLLAPRGRYVGIGGGMADYTFAGFGPVSVCQAAQRNMFRFYAMEAGGEPSPIVELMVNSHIVDSDDEGEANTRDVRSGEVGAHVRAVIEQPDVFPGPILVLKSRKQIGQPER
jgi:NAD(P)-dependent dehydrogenase (short-subunit alcohol dehydrogenase family)